MITDQSPHNRRNPAADSVQSQRHAGEKDERNATPKLAIRFGRLLGPALLGAISLTAQGQPATPASGNLMAPPLSEEPALEDSWLACADFSWSGPECIFENDQVLIRIPIQDMREALRTLQVKYGIRADDRRLIRAIEAAREDVRLHDLDSASIARASLLVADLLAQSRCIVFSKVSETNQPAIILRRTSVVAFEYRQFLLTHSIHPFLSITATHAK